MFYEQFGQKESHSIRLAVMNMRKPLPNVTNTHVPQSAILFDRLHGIRHLGAALDKARKTK